VKFSGSRVARETTDREAYDLAAEANWRSTAVRWMKFNSVGALGIALQLAVLFVLKSGFHLSYLPATALAAKQRSFTTFSGTSVTPGRTEYSRRGESRCRACCASI